MKRIIRYSDNLILSASFVSNEILHQAIMAGLSTKEMMKQLVRVKSSNLWGYAISARDRKEKVGNVLVQFKDERGGPGDVYIYYDVPVNIFRKWHSASSKGHFFWVYIRNHYRYSKLTGDKRGKLKNAVN